MVYAYGCGKCKNEFDVIKSHVDMDRVEYCECGAEAVRLFRPNANAIFKSKGIQTGPEYNPGLGMVVKSRQHLKDICKERGLEPIGNERPETIHKTYDKQREEKLEKTWSEPDGWIGDGST